MTRRKQTTEAQEAQDQDSNVQIDEVVPETEILDETDNQPAIDQLSLNVNNHGSRYWDMVNKIWIEEGYNFLTFDDEIKKLKLTDNLTQVNMLAGYDRFEWVG